MNTDFKSINIRHLVAVMILLAAVVFVNQNGFNGSFHSDDYTTIQSHPEIEHPESFWNFPPHYRQWLTASFAINFAYGGLDSWGYHAVNLALHLISTCLLMALIRLTLFEGYGWKAPSANRVAFIAGALFALHPVHTETITYISGRSSGLSSLFYLSSLYFFAISQLKKTGSGKKIIAFPLLFLAGIGAALSKETSLTLPLGLLLFDLCFMRGFSWAPPSLRWKIIYGPLVAGAVLLFLISPTFSIQAQHWLNRIQWNLTLDQLPVLAHALKLIFLPFNLTFDYDFPRASFLSGPFQIVSILFWIILLVTAWKFRRQSPPVFTFAVFWFLIILSPTNSILPRMDLLSERNLYLPSIGICWWGGLLLNSLLEKKSAFRSTPLMTASALIICVCFGSLTHHRNHVYLNDVTLWQDTLEKSPNKSEVHYYLAMAHFLAGDSAEARREMARLSKKYPALARKVTASDEASRKQWKSHLQLLENLKQIVQSDPGQYKMYGQVYRELAGLHRNQTPLYFTRLLSGVQLATQGKLKQAEAEFRQARTARPHLPHAYLDLAALFVRKGLLPQAFKETELAKNKMHLAPNLKPRFHLTRARILLRQNQFKEAKQEATQLLNSASEKSDGYLLLGNIELALGHANEAIAHWQKVLTSPKIKAEVLFKIAMAQVSQNRIDEAQATLTQTLQLAPENLSARFNLAKLILEHGGDQNLARHHLEILLNQTKDANKRQMVEQLLSRIPPDHDLN